MKKTGNFSVYLLCYIFLSLEFGFAQGIKPGDLAFIGFNASGNDDFALVALSNIPANTTLYISDNESDGNGGVTSGEGALTWFTGNQMITVGTVMTFNDVDNGNGNISCSVGTIIESDLGFNISASDKDGLLIYTGNDDRSPNVFITGIQIGNDPSELGPFDNDGITLTNTGLVSGLNLIIFDDSASPNGASYIGPRSNQSTFLNYFSLLADVGTNWINVVNGDGETILPFSTERFTTTSTVWTGNQDANWNSSPNWTDGIPHQNSSVVIPNNMRLPIINSNTHVTINNLTISDGSALTIEPGGSIIVHNSSIGNVIYRRNLEFVSGNTNGWYLLSPPITGEIFDDQFIAKNNIAHGSSNNRGIGSFDTPSNYWRYHQAGTSVDAISGVGYSVKTSENTVIEFIGQLATSDIHVPVSTSNIGYNLIGNPYASYISSEYFLSDNQNVDAQIWTWNHEEGFYRVRPKIENFIIAPGQAFFIRANNGNSVVFSKINQLGSEDTFQKKDKAEIEIILKGNNLKRIAKLFFFEGSVTIDHDIGYEGEIFDAINSELNIYSRLIDNSQDKKYQVQSLPKDKLESLEVPLGIKSLASNELTMEIKTTNFPNHLQIYLKDTYNNRLYLLEDHTSIEFAIEEAKEYKDRFKLFFSSKTLHVDSLNKEDLRIWTTNTNTLMIRGINSKYYSIELYDSLGKKQFTKFHRDVPQPEFKLNGLSKGIYFIKVKTERNTYNKKIIIQ